MATQWYVTVEGEQKGPLTGAQLKQLVREGKVTPDTPLSMTEDGKMVPASQVKGLFDTEIAPPPPPQHEGKLQPCPDCERPVSSSAATCPGCGCPLEAPAKLQDNKYPALVFIAGLSKFFTVIVPILCLVGLFVVLNADVPGKEETAISIVVYMVLAPLFMWGSAELILLLIDVESNTRRPSRARNGRKSTPPHDLPQEEREKARSQEKEENTRKRLAPDLLPLLDSEERVFIVVNCRDQAAMYRYVDWRGSVLKSLKAIGFVQQDTRSALVRSSSTELRGHIDAARLLDVARLPAVLTVSRLTGRH